MADRITPELFNHLVELAALELPPDESEYLRKELNNQLKAIRELEAIPLENDMEITSHGVPYTSETRPEIRSDKWVKNENTELILGQAPEIEDRHIVVPEIPHEDLD